MRVKPTPSRQPSTLFVPHLDVTGLMQVQSFSWGLFCEVPATADWRVNFMSLYSFSLSTIANPNRTSMSFGTNLVLCKQSRGFLKIEN
jgi:hypothetical protein